METKEVAKVEKLPADMTAKILSGETSLFLNVAKFEHAQRVAQMLATSNMLPDQFKGSTGDCLIALNLAERFQADPFMVMQSMYVVHGKPGLEGKLVAALINASGKYSEPLRYEFGAGTNISDEYDDAETEKTSPSYGCRAVTVDAKSGKTVKGPKISWKIIKAEGWYAKNGSKWKTFPELMFMYRAASWFANIHCPEVKLGMQTVEELKDIVDLERGTNGSFATPEIVVEDLEAKILKRVEPEKEKNARAKKSAEDVSVNKNGPLYDPWYARGNWKDKKSTGYPAFLWENIDRMDEVPDEIYSAMVKKWEGMDALKSQPFPAKPIEGVEVVNGGNGTPDESSDEPGPSDDDIPGDIQEATEREAVIQAILKYNAGQIEAAQTKLTFAVGVNNLNLHLDALNVLLEKLVVEFGEVPHDD